MDYKKRSKIFVLEKTKGIVEKVLGEIKAENSLNMIDTYRIKKLSEYQTG